MDPNTLSVIQGAAGAGGDDKIYVEDVFSTYCYVGSSGTPTITNGIDLLGEGGLIWTKWRSGGSYSVESHALVDTDNEHLLSTDNTGTGWNADHYFTFQSTGYQIDTGSSLVNHNSGGKYCSWTFRKAPGFFDVVSYPGTSAAKTVPHNLDCVPGCILVKKIDGTEPWAVYHKGTGNHNVGTLNENYAFGPDSDMWDDTTPTSSVFTVGSGNTTNEDTKNYIAYLFADGDDAAAQIFGDDGDESIIKCGTYEGDGQSAGFFEEIGFEPQWILLKDADTGGTTAPWIMVDDMRGWAMGTDQDGTARYIYANGNDSESGSTGKLSPRATGINIDGSSSWVNTSGKTFIYVAIRRGAMKTPEDATKVFKVVEATQQPMSIGFTTDLAIVTPTDYGGAKYFVTRLTSTYHNVTTDGQPTSAGSSFEFDLQNDFSYSDFYGNWDTINWIFKRAAGFFDVVAYQGTGSAHTEDHNLGVIPEMMVIKCLDANEHWVVYHKELDAGHYLYLDDSDDEDTDSSWLNNTDPTASVFSVGATNNRSNGPSESYVAYLFASCPGVSKVGSYDGTGNDIDIDCGFTNGARFVMIKRTNGSGDWYVWDSVRGIVSGDDSYLRINSQYQEITFEDYLDPYTSGFRVPSTAINDQNTNGGKYIYLAIA